MKAEVCLESAQPCLISADIARDMYLPKAKCDWSIDFPGWYQPCSLKHESL